MGLYAGYGFVTEKGNRALRDDRFGALRGGFNGKRTYQGNTDCGGNVRYQGACQRKIEWLYAQGVRIASFCWNEENLLATGVKGNPEHTYPLGEEALQAMIDCNMLVDVSHANERTFWDIMAHPQHALSPRIPMRERCVIIPGIFGTIRLSLSQSGVESSV